MKTPVTKASAAEADNTQRIEVPSSSPRRGGVDETVERHDAAPVSTAALCSTADVTKVAQTAASRVKVVAKIDGNGSIPSPEGVPGQPVRP